MTIQPSEISTYLECLFQNHAWQADEFLQIRGVGEKGTRQEGVFAEDHPLQPALYDPCGPIAEAADRYSQHLIGTFIVPAVLSAPKATEENVRLLPMILLDLDSIPAWEAVEWLAENIGEPTMIVASGGRNEHGPKLHVYYILDTPAPAPEVIPLATAMADLLGSDQIFMRRTQPIRVPGSVHLKDGIPKEVRVERWSTDTFTLEELRGKLATAEASPWATAKGVSMSHKQAGVSFSPATSTDSAALLTTTIKSGGSDGITRFDAFSRVAGHYLHVARQGGMNEAEAYNALTGWAAAHLSPPWPDERVRKEWQALLDREITARGPMPEARTYTPIVAAAEGGKELGLKAWAAHRWVTLPKPEHSFLVDSLIIQGEPHLFVAEGGAGKTFLLADLAMKLASFKPDGPELEWCGQKIVKGGTCVLILCEDSQTEMHIRLIELDKEGLIQAAGDRLIVLPMTRIGGAFPLTERDPKSGAAVASQRWNEMVGLLKQLPDLAMVAIDTLNSVSHGDENSAVVISEMMREAHRVCGELGAALVINHHLRKSNEPIRSLEDLRDGIRGSTAIPSYFRINFGMFRAGDWERRCRALGIKPHKDNVWRFGVAKANIMGLFDGEKTLVRTNGAIKDMTEQDPFNCASMSVRLSWLVLVIAKAAEDGFPFSHGGKNALDGLYKRRSQLPEEIGRLGHTELGMALESAFSSKSIVQCAAKSGSSSKFVDVPGGPFARNDQGETVARGAWKVPDWSEYVYDEGQGKCVKKLPKMMMKISENN